MNWAVRSIRRGSDKSAVTPVCHEFAGTKVRPTFARYLTTGTDTQTAEQSEFSKTLPTHKNAIITMNAHRFGFRWT